MGSVKDLQVLKEPLKDEMGIGRFHFSDRYSVFDWGEMPDTIPRKGAALCMMGAHCFELAENKGVKTHYRGLVTQTGRLARTDEIDSAITTMDVNLLRIIRPKFSNGKYDYSIFQSLNGNFLIPLEIIYRNGLPKESSVFKRLERNEITYRDLGIDHYPTPGERFKEPILDVSTKLEEKDRYITWKEAQEISGLEDEELYNIKVILLDANDVNTSVAKIQGLVNEDGKIEVGFDHVREPMLVDVLGTLDECRFTYDGLDVSKEVARKFYRQTEWYKEVEKAKTLAKERKVEEWKKFCEVQPPKLDPQLKNVISQMYMSVANGMLRKNIFESPKLHEVMKEYQEIANRLKL